MRCRADECLRGPLVRSIHSRTHMPKSQFSFWTLSAIEPFTLRNCRRRRRRSHLYVEGLDPAFKIVTDCLLEGFQSCSASPIIAFTYTLIRLELRHRFLLIHQCLSLLALVPLSRYDTRAWLSPFSHRLLLRAFTFVSLPYSTGRAEPSSD